MCPAADAHQSHFPLAACTPVHASKRRHCLPRAINAPRHLSTHPPLVCSERERTHAARRLADDVPQDVKLRRLSELIDVYRAGLHACNDAEVGRRHLVLVEGRSRRSSDALTGRSDTFKRVVFPDVALPSSYFGATSAGWLGSAPAPEIAAIAEGRESGAQGLARALPGDYVAVEVTAAAGGTLMARPLARTTLAEFVAVHGTAVPLEVHPLENDLHRGNLPAGLAASV